MPNAWNAQKMKGHMPHRWGRLRGRGGDAEYTRYSWILDCLNSSHGILTMTIFVAILFVSRNRNYNYGWRKIPRTPGRIPICDTVSGMTRIPKIWLETLFSSPSLRDPDEKSVCSLRPGNGHSTNAVPEVWMAARHGFAITSVGKRPLHTNGNWKFLVCPFISLLR